MAHSNSTTETRIIRRTTTRPAPAPAPAFKRYNRQDGDWLAVGEGNVTLGFFTSPQEADRAIEAHSYRMAALTGAKGGTR